MSDRSKPGTNGLVSLALACLVAFPATSIAQQTETFRLSGNEVAIYNLAGKVQVRGGSGSDVVVSVRRGGSDAGRLDVQTGNVNTGHSDPFAAIIDRLDPQGFVRTRSTRRL